MDSRIDAMNYEAFAATFAQDYLDQKTAAGTDIGYKKKTDLKPATVAKFNVPKSNVETLKPPKSATASSTATSSTAYSVNLDELSDEIIESK
jgi:hypothetical protein